MTSPGEAGTAFAPSRAQALLPGVWRVIAGPQVLSLADQAVVSGTSFLTTVLVARWSDPRELGIYAIGVSLIVTVLAVQDALILQPYAIQRPHAPKALAKPAGISLLLSAALSLVMAVALGAVAFAFAAGGVGGAIVAMAWAVAAVVPFALARESAAATLSRICA